MTPVEFKQARLEKGMTQRELASFLGEGASYSAVTKWEVGANPIPQWVVDKMTVRNKLTLDDLSAEELAALVKRAAEKNLSPDTLAAEVIRAFIRLS